MAAKKRRFGFKIKTFRHKILFLFAFNVICRKGATVGPSQNVEILLRGASLTLNSFNHNENYLFTDYNLYRSIHKSVYSGVPGALAAILKGNAADFQRERTAQTFRN